jgi:heptosyltransferase-2
MKVLLIRFSSLGDCILLCPLVSHLKQNGADKVVVVTKQTYATLLSAAAGVDQVIGYEPRTGIGGLRRLAARFRDRGYTVIDAHSTARSRLLAWMLGGAGSRFQKHYRDRLGLIVFKRPVVLPSMLEQYGALATAAGLPAVTLSPGGINVPAPYTEAAREAMNGDNRPWIALAPGSRWPAKRWPVGKYAELADRLSRNRGYRILLMGDGTDRQFTSVVAEAAGDSCLDITGRTSVLEGAGYLGGCCGFVGNDSGLTHLAEAAGVPAVVLFGPTVESFGYYPSLPGSKVVERELGCRPCSRNGSRPCIRGTRECLAEIGVDTVEAAVLEMASGTGPRRYVVKK